MAGGAAQANMRTGPIAQHSELQPVAAGTRGQALTSAVAPRRPPPAPAYGIEADGAWRVMAMASVMGYLLFAA